jgi:hypothetical protein
MSIPILDNAIVTGNLTATGAVSSQSVMYASGGNSNQ